MSPKKRLLEERDRMLRQRRALENQIAGLNLAIAIVEDLPDDGDEEAQPNASPSGGGPVVLTGGVG